MAQVQTKSLLEYIRGVLAEADADKQSDRELLSRFSAQHDEVAFKAILRRHGPMVLRSCQRLLDRREDAEDVFQATFLVLSRKAAALRWRESIGAWLYAVAHRLAQETRRKHLGRLVHEARVRPRAAEDPLAEVSGRELVAILDEELANLPERYRAPLLFHLEGMSGDEAARQLGCSASTFKRRLRRARALLQNRLSRKGIALSAALSAMLLCNSARAALTPSFAAATAQAAALLAAGEKLTTGLVSAQALALAGGLARATIFSRLPLALVVLIAGSGLVVGSIALGQRTPSAIPAEAAVPQPRAPIQPVAAVIETTLATAPGRIRQLAFDGDSSTYFASAQNAGPADHFTLIFDRPVAVKSLAVQTGRTDGSDRLDLGTLDISEDGNKFEPLASFAGGAASAQPHGRLLRAVRVRPKANLRHPLAVREMAVDSDPPVLVFKYPVEFVVDVAEAPEMSAWAQKVARICERTYPMIHEELKAEAFRPAQEIKITLKKDCQTIAETSKGRITGSASYFKQNPDDVGALVYSTVFCVQNYCGRGQLSWLKDEMVDRLRSFTDDPRISQATDPLRPRLNANFHALAALALYLTEERDANPAWLAQGIADYVRFFKYEPGRLGPFDPQRGEYSNNSRTAAAFLAYLTAKYDADIVAKLNRVMKVRKYEEEIFKTLTGKTLVELREEWQASLRNKE